MLWTILFAFRWPMVLGFAVLAISLGFIGQDPEQVLPRVLSSEFFPAGVRGVVIAAMLAAAMSTFDSTINAGASYIVKDLYQIARPRAPERELVWAGYGASLFIVLLGLAIAFNVKSVVDVWVAIVINLFPAFLVPFALRWFWSRFNGGGFALGVIGGFAASILVFVYGKTLGINELASLGGIAACSLVFSIAGTFLTTPTDPAVLESFYRLVRPFGAWPSEWLKPDRAEHRNDLIRLAVALVWQVTTFLIPMGLVLHMWTESIVASFVWLISGAYLVLEGRRTDRSG
jgi:Na+/proline symporter